MRIRVSIAVEVDVQEWCEEYGCEPSRVRDDVGVLIRSQIDECAAPIRVVA